MKTVQQLISGVIEREGGAQYTDHAEDSGGPTKYGVTLRTLAKWRSSVLTADDVRNLSEEEARQIYLSRYWYRPGFDKIAPISHFVARELLDTGINMGPATAVTFLQRTLNLFNDRQRHYRDMKVDGYAGPVTREALSLYLGRRAGQGEIVLLFCLDALQVADGARGYMAIAERREKDEAFVYGQILNRAQERWTYER